MIEDRIFLYNDNCYTRIKKIPDKSIDLIITDPPYDYTEGGLGVFTLTTDKGYSKKRTTRRRCFWQQK